MEKYLTLEQNLCGAKLFLNFFGLNLELKENVTEFDKVKIYDANSNEVGVVSFSEGTVNINCLTNFGELAANYEIGKFFGFRDIETDCGVFTEWRHPIKFKLSNKKLEGDLMMHVCVDTTFGINFRTHATLKYTDKGKKKVTLEFMDNGNPFSYVASKDDFKEEIKISPWNDFEPYMYHTIRDGKYDEENHCFPYEKVSSIWHNGYKDKKHLVTVDTLIKDFEVLKDSKKFHDRTGEDNSIESTIQKGNIIHEIDESFAIKIQEIIDEFNIDDVSLIENLISTSFYRHTDEEIKALFGIDIKKMKYYSDADNVIDAYFINNKKNLFVPEHSYAKLLNKKNS